MEFFICIEVLRGVFGLVFFFVLKLVDIMLCELMDYMEFVCINWVCIVFGVLMMFGFSLG